MYRMKNGRIGSKKRSEDQSDGHASIIRMVNIKYNLMIKDFFEVVMKPMIVNIIKITPATMAREPGLKRGNTVMGSIVYA